MWRIGVWGEMPSIERCSKVIAAIGSLFALLKAPPDQLSVSLLFTAVPFLIPIFSEIASVSLSLTIHCLH